MSNVEFTRYSSIDNHYNVKFLSKIPEALRTVPYVVTEKLDGGNFTVLIRPNVTPMYGKRSGWLSDDENFFDYKNVITKYPELQYFQIQANNQGKTFKLVGEIYGVGINKRIDYGPEKYLKFFELWEDGVQLSPRWIQHHYVNHVGLKFFCDYTKVYNGLFSALEHNVENQNIEGVIIRPYDTNETLPSGEKLIIKKKSVAFADKENKAAVGKIAKFSSKALEYNNVFRGYINKNRMLDMFGKVGAPIQDMKEMGKYILLIMDDAKADFIKDNPEVLIIEPKELKVVFNVGADIANLLRNYLILSSSVESE